MLIMSHPSSHYYSQVDGRKRLSVTVPSSYSSEELERTALSEAEEKGLLSSSVRRTIVVPHKHIVNFVIN